MVSFNIVPGVRDPAVRVGSRCTVAVCIQSTRAACLAVAMMFALVVLLTGDGWHAVAAQAPVVPSVPLELTRVSKPIVIDGVMDDEGWKGVPELPLTLYTPTFRGTPTQRSTIRVAYDDDYFYAGGWFHDTNASQIRINSLYRDRWNGDDAVAIYLDTFHDKQNAKWFGVTAAGNRFDVLLSDDGATQNPNWDTFWSAKTTVTDSGWFVEVRIPFSSLGFRVDSTGKAIMGLTITRLVSRLDERVTFPAIDPKFDFRRPSQAQEIVLRNVHSRTPLYVTPYALAGMEQTTVPRSPTGFSLQRQGSRNIGADVRYPLSGNLTLDVTANTDFAQVEADDQQVNLDRFPLFYPERRRFFQEGSGIFDFVAGSNTRLFNSRRIGLTSDFTPIPVFGGGRLVGRAGAFDIGVLDMQTRADSTTPTANFGVLRLRRQVIDPLSTAGLVFTSYDAAGRHSVAYGADGSLHVHGDHYLSLKWAATSDNTDTSRSSFAARSLFDAKWERKTQKGLGYSFAATRAGQDFAPELGFLQRHDFTTVNAIGNYYLFTDNSRFFRRVYPGALAFSTWRNHDGALESGQYAVWVEWDTKTGGNGWIEPKLFHENVLIPFTIAGNAKIPTGRYDFADLQVALSMATGRKLRTGMDFRTGTYFDGTRTQIILNPTWNVSQHLEIGGDYQLSHLRFASRQQGTDIQLARLRFRLALDAQKSGNAFLQYNSTTRRLDVNVRLRYAIAEGTDLWFVYNEGLDTDRAILPGVPQAPLSLARTMIVKYSHTLSF